MKRKHILYLVLVFVLPLLVSCAPRTEVPATEGQQAAAEPDLPRLLTAVEDEPDTVDFQCTSIHYTIEIGREHTSELQSRI